MGKAGKWIRNLLMGKKEEKFKKIDAICTENTSIANSDSPKVKRRWSFGRLSGGRTTRKVTGHKYSMSFDSGDTAKLDIQALLQNQAPQNIPTAKAKVFVQDTKLRCLAATKIQAAFRSYLARKALHALRGLVKIQALVRGHLVRKQATATLRGMHALMAIQVRARIQRIQMVEEANLLAKQPVLQHREIPHSKGLITEVKDSKEMSVEEMLEVLKSRRGSLGRSHVKNMKHDSMTFYSKRNSVSERHEYNENNLVTAPNSPENYWLLSEFNPTTMVASTSQCRSVSHRQPWSPSYMNNTESSKAKARSQSEPKQRPKRGMKQKSKSAESPKELITTVKGPKQNLFNNSSRFDHGSLDHWAANLYGSTKDSSRRNSFESSTMTSDSYH